MYRERWNADGLSGGVTRATGFVIGVLALSFAGPALAQGKGGKQAGPTLADTESEQAAVEARFNSIEENIDKLQQQVETLRSEGGNAAAIARLEAAVRQLEADLVATRRAAEMQANAADELKHRINVLADEIEKLKAGADLFPAAKESRYGLGPAASKVYAVDHGVSIGGYGELLYENFAGKNESNAPSGQTDRLDMLRAVLYFGYKFTDKIVFNSELEFEHASTGEGVGEVSVEFAYLDFMLSDHLGLRAGLLLVPLGWVNELHEPPVFLGARRPQTEQRIIPTTWRETGAGFFGEAADFSYRLYLVTGFDGVGGGSAHAEGFSEKGLRDGRQGGRKAAAESFAATGRLDYAGVPGLAFGLGAYMGNAGQGVEDPANGQTIGLRTSLLDFHADYRFRGLELRGLVAFAEVADADKLNALRAAAADPADVPAPVGSRMLGYYLQAGYDIVRLWATSEHQFIPYARYELVDTHAEMPAGYTASDAMNERIVTVGAAYKPLTNIAVKADYELHHTGADSGVNQFNLNLGFLF